MSTAPASAGPAAQENAKPLLLLGTLSIFFGNLATLAVLALVYLNFCLFKDYAIMLLWATLLAIGLHRSRDVFASISDNDWVDRGIDAFQQRAATYVFLLVAWLWALCNAFGVVPVLLLHASIALAGYGYNRLARCGGGQCCCCSDAVVGALVLLVGGFIVSGLVLVGFAVKCTEEGAEAVARLHDWGQRMADAAKGDGADDASGGIGGDGHELWVQVGIFLESEQVQGAIQSAKASVGDLLESLSQVGGEGFVEQIRHCYSASGGNAAQVGTCETCVHADAYFRFVYGSVHVTHSATTGKCSMRFACMKYFFFFISMNRKRKERCEMERLAVRIEGRDDEKRSD